MLAAVFVFLLAPIVVVVISSFSAVGVLSFPPRAFTTRWYSEIDPTYYRALVVSLITADDHGRHRGCWSGFRVRWRWHGAGFPAAPRSTRSASRR